MEQSAKSQKVDFGYEEIPWEDKAKRVNQVFSSVATNYDVMNDLMSLGIHRVWKRVAISRLNVRADDAVLDLAGGTGDMTRLMIDRIKGGQIYLADLNSDMLKCGRSRLIDAGLYQNISYVQANAEALPFSAQSFDRIVMAFGLRNVRDKASALASMYACLKPGGRLVVLEFSQLQMACLKSIYDTYSFNVLPWLGKMIAGDAQSYQYLAESIRVHPDQETLKDMMRTAGFDEVRYENLSGGIVAIHIAEKY